MAAKSMMFLVLVMSIILAIGLVSAQNTTTTTTSLRMAARDAITLAVGEITYTQNFINTLPRLMVVRTAMPNQVALRSCVAGLVESLREANTVLKRMRGHLNNMATGSQFIDIDTDDDALTNAVANRISSYDDVCQVGLGTIDRSRIMEILNRKLDDVMMLATNVVNHVSQINTSW